jgi:hypothetical protein
MTFDDVPAEAAIVFIGGSSAWKDDAIVPWCARFPGRVHVARVNELERLMKCYRAGAVSVDGTGWFHKDTSDRRVSQYTQLRRYLEHAREVLA